MSVREALLALGMLLVLPLSAAAQSGHDHHGSPAAAEAGEQHGDMQDMPGMQHDAHGADDPAASYLMQQSSGTGTQPTSWPMPMRMFERGAWQFGAMGQMFLVYTGQSGPRGNDGGYSVNWLMGSASRRLGPGRLQVRGMISLEPATVPDRAYPLLFQTGETAYGTPLVDGQHPHDFVMELSAQYVQPFGTAGLLDVYYAPVGDPAIGPVAFPHRASAFELPQATLGHHWEDSTHIATNVLTLGWAKGALRVEGSGFHGAEPDEQRWDIDTGAMDSWAVRASVAPHPDWMGQVSFARLRRPEVQHADDVDRTTASVHHVARWGNRGAIATSAIWATNHKRVEGTRTHAVTLETLVPVTRRDTISSRFEWSQRDELFENDHQLAADIEAATGKAAFPVSALTVGYTRDLVTAAGLQFGLGGSITRYWADEALTPFYGRRPWGASVFLRVRLAGE